MPDSIKRRRAPKGRITVTIVGDGPFRKKHAFLAGGKRSRRDMLENE